MRLFVALELDEKAKALLAEHQERLSDLDRLVRWVRPEQIHLTLKFLGEVPDSQVAEVGLAINVLGEHREFEFRIEGLGTFGGPRSPRVIWAGVGWPNEPLANLQKTCEKSLTAMGFEPEGRAYKPHLTLGRVKEFSRAGRTIQEAVERQRAQAAGPLVQRAEQVILFQSILRPTGSEYVQVHKVLLGKG